MIDAVIFDLDGTLVDSSDGVLLSFRSAFSATGLDPVRPVTSAIIGPPLKDTLSVLAGTEDEDTLRALVSEFKTTYDSHCYKRTVPFTGVDEMLRELVGCGHPLYIATNKRLLPTKRILDHLGWSDVFKGVYALDFFRPPLRRKADMLAQIVLLHDLDPQHSIYIGDRDEDSEAAINNGLHFGFAAWGYGCDGTTMHRSPAFITMKRPETVAFIISTLCMMPGK